MIAAVVRILIWGPLWVLMAITAGIAALLFGRKGRDLEGY